MADFSNSISAPSVDPILQALAAERDAAAAFHAAIEAIADTGAQAAWLDYQTQDLEEAEAQAGAALSEAERQVLNTRPVSLRGTAALLGFLRRYLANHPEMPPSIRRVLAALENAEAVLLWSLGGPPAAA